MVSFLTLQLESTLLTTKTRCVCTQVHDAFSLFMKIGGPAKGGVGGGGGGVRSRPRPMYPHLRYKMIINDFLFSTFLQIVPTLAFLKVTQHAA